MKSPSVKKITSLVWGLPALTLAAFNFDWDPTLNPFEFEANIDQFKAEIEFTEDPVAKAAFQDSIDVYLAKTDSIQKLTIPIKLSALGFYTNIATETVTPEAHGFQVNSALWSDGSHKHRWIVLPPGGKVAFKPDVDLFDYPDKAIMVKLFRLQKSATDTTTFPWETRLLVNNEEERNGKMEDIWYFFTYKWNKDKTDADLVSLVNGFDTTYFANNVPNTTDYVKWKYPDVGTCGQCHRKDFGLSAKTGATMAGRAVLGFFPAQLSRPTATGNQITDLFTQEVFSGTPPTAAQLSRRWIGMEEPLPPVVGGDRKARDSVLNIMSRAYIAANCSGCHGERGLAVGAPFHVKPKFDFHELKFYPMGKLTPTRQLKWYEDTTMTKLQDSLTTWDFTISGSALIRPGRPDLSIIVVRQKQRNSDLNKTQNPDSTISYSPARTEITQMPPYATYKVNEPAVAVMEEWIRYMPDSTGAVPALGIRQPAESGKAAKAPILLDRKLIVPEGWEGRVELISVQGRRTELKRSLGNAYAIPDGIPNGVYMIRIGDRSFTRYLN